MGLEGAFLNFTGALLHSSPKIGGPWPLWLPRFLHPWVRASVNPRVVFWRTLISILENSLRDCPSPPKKFYGFTSPSFCRKCRKSIFRKYAMFLKIFLKPLAAVSIKERNSILALVSMPQRTGISEMGTCFYLVNNIVTKPQSGQWIRSIFIIKAQNSNVCVTYEPVTSLPWM